MVRVGGGILICPIMLLSISCSNFSLYSLALFAPSFLLPDTSVLSHGFIVSVLKGNCFTKLHVL